MHIDGTLALGHSIVALGQDVSVTLTSAATLGATITGALSSDVGSIRAESGTSGQVVTLGGAADVTLDQGYIPQDGQRSDIVDVPDGSVTGSFAAETTPGIGWTSETNPTSYSLTYATPFADLAVSGGAQLQASQGSTIHAAATLSDLGPFASPHASLHLTVGSRVRVLSVSPACERTSQRAFLCHLGPLSSGDSATVTLTLRALEPGFGRVTARSFPRGVDPDATNNAASFRTWII